jgi:hypothetical protein
VTPSDLYKEPGIELHIGLEEKQKASELEERSCSLNMLLPSSSTCENPDCNGVDRREEGPEV